MTPSHRPSAMDRHARAVVRVIYKYVVNSRDLAAGRVCYASGWGGSLLVCGD